MIEELNRKWKIYKEKIEKQMNRNCLPFGDLQPIGENGGYHIPLVIGFQKENLGEPVAGYCRDFELLKEKADVPRIKFKKMIGYTACARAEINDMQYFDRLMRCLIKEIRLTVEHALGFPPTEPSYGYYIKFSDFKDEENYAACSFEVECNAYPMVQLGRDRNDQRL